MFVWLSTGKPQALVPRCSRFSEVGIGTTYDLEDRIYLYGLDRKFYFYLFHNFVYQVVSHLITPCSCG
jgi:hypothetical protein